MSLLLSAGLAALSAAEWPESPPRSRPSVAAANRGLTLLFSGELEGYLSPCGCSQPMLGGLLRRGTYLRGLPTDQPSVRIEGGDLTLAQGRQDELKAETLMEMLNVLGYDAVGLGEKDFRLGQPFLLSLQARLRGALLCAGVRRPDDTLPFKEYIVLRRSIGGRSVRIVVVGLLSEAQATLAREETRDLRFETPAQVLQRLQPEITAAGDVRVLLLHGSRYEAEALARQFPVFQAILCAHEGDRPEELTWVGATVLAAIGENGKYMGRIDLLPGQTWRAASVRATALGPEFGDDARVAPLKRAYLERVAQEDLLRQVPRVPTTNGDVYAGSAACAPCHADAYRIWKASKHAKAMQTLVDVQEERDPECVVCHAVGAGQESGFVRRDKTPSLQGVGCESCHGPAARHVRNPGAALSRAGAQSCLTCHVPQQSPRFDFTRYWEKIRHGAVKGPNR